MNRRGFLRTGLAAGSAWLAGCSGKTPLAGEWRGTEHERSHRLRTGDFPSPVEERRVGVVIVGGGVAGLSAAWQLARQGFHDFVMLESQDETGGNARAGESPVTAYPWGAHYLPLPTREASDLVAMLRDLDVITGLERDGTPRYDERYIVSPPRERLYYLGQWQSGHEPRVPAVARAQFDRFHARVEALKHQRGSDGRPVFATPSAYSTRDARWIALDRLSMRQWMTQAGFTDPRLLWSVEYACRDDFGSTLDDTSAWAGLHYVAGRQPFSNPDSDTVLTWPEGNAFLTRKLAARVARQIATGQLCYRVTSGERDATVHVFDGIVSRVYRARQVILAVPLFVAARLMPGLSPPTADYAPWLVANLHVQRLPHGEGAGPYWDNVLYDSPSVGYVVATHQQLRQSVRESVLTYYWPLTHVPPLEGRRLLLERPWREWAQLVLADLKSAHPDIEALTARLDLWRWGHGMIKPRPGLLFSGDLARVRTARGRVHLAHTDLSGMSLFEEAHYWGVTAARAVLAAFT